VQEQINILVGTMTGTAELVADDVKAELEAGGFAVDILPMDNLDATVFERPGLFLICTSTYGQGDVPDNARAFFEDLQARRPDLAGIRFGVIGLGDSTYADTYCNGGKQFDDLLQALGARRIGERLDHNASGTSLPEVAAVEWVRRWSELLSPLAMAAE